MALLLDEWYTTSVPVKTNVESSTRMVLEVAAVAGAAGLVTPSKQSLAWVKEELKLMCQTTQGKKKLLVEILKDALNKKIVRYSTLEESKENSKSRKKKNLVMVVE